MVNWGHAQAKRLYRTKHLQFPVLTDRAFSSRSMSDCCPRSGPEGPNQAFVADKAVISDNIDINKLWLFLESTKDVCAHCEIWECCAAIVPMLPRAPGKIYMGIAAIPLSQSEDLDVHTMGENATTVTPGVGVATSIYHLEGSSYNAQVNATFFVVLDDDEEDFVGPYTLPPLMGTIVDATESALQELECQGSNETACLELLPPDWWW